VIALFTLLVVAMRASPTAPSHPRPGSHAGPTRGETSTDAPAPNRSDASNASNASDTHSAEPSDTLPVVGTNAAVDSQAQIGQGAELYSNCVMCHGPTGEGIKGQYPPLAGSPIVLGSPSRFARVLLHGIEGPVIVKGEVYDTPMPAAPLADDEAVAAVMTFVRQAFGNKAGPITPAFVAKVREETSSRETSWTAKELDDVP
jgi:mono/diheme cytochrome c family protein